MDSKEFKEIVNELKKLEQRQENMETFFKTKIVKSKKKIDNQVLIIICITILLALSLIGNAFCVYQLSQYEKIEETVENYEINQETNDDSDIVNGNQYNDNSTHNENKGK